MTTSCCSPGCQLLRKLADAVAVPAYTWPTTQLFPGQPKDYQYETDFQSSQGLVSRVWRHLQGLHVQKTLHSGYRYAKVTHTGL